MKLSLSNFTACLLLTLAGNATADVESFNGTTIGGLTFHRPTGDDYPLSPDGATLSSLGTEWSYQVNYLTVGTSADYSFTVTSNDFDIYVALYGSSLSDGGFHPGDPTSGLVALLDGADGSPIFTYETTLSSVPLEAGKTYAFVVTSYWDNVNKDLSGNVPEGDFSASISGPGSIEGQIPEPAAPLLTALGSLVLFRRRRAA